LGEAEPDPPLPPARFFVPIVVAVVMIVGAFVAFALIASR
jgi:hypothetical protein